VHAVDAAGQLVAQHDAVPGTGLRPTTTWEPGETVVDRHGLLLPADRGGPLELRLRVGLYDAQSGARVPLPDGRDAIEIGVCRVEAP
jgi:hypothetical protein